MKKILSVILCLALLTGSVILGYSASDEAWKENTGVINLTKMTTSGNGAEFSGVDVKITKGGDFTVMGETKDGMIYINTAERVKLRLDGATIINPDGPAIFFDNADKAFITIEKGSENYIEDGATYKEDAKAALFSNDDLEIKGGGKLVIKANFKHGIASDDDVVIESGNVEITSKEHGIKANDLINILDGEISVTSKEGKGLKADKEILIEGGKLNINSETNEGIESEGKLTIKGGEINITAVGNGINTAKSDVAGTVYDIKISGGELNIKAGESGIDSNGNVAITGGNIYLNTSFVEKKAPVDSKGNLEITGGKVFLDGKEISDASELAKIPSEAVDPDKIRVTLGGKELSFTSDPVIKNGTTLVGFRAILEALGASVTWDGENRCAIAEKDGTKIELYIDSVKAYVNGEEKILLTAPEIINSTTMIPVRFVSENLGMKVTWDEAERKVIIENN